MKSSYISLGYKCNHRCVTCPLSYSDRQMVDTPLETIYKNLKSLQQGDHVTISGGETTLYSSLYDVLKYCRNSGISATILSNSSGFANKEYAEKMAELCVHPTIDIVTAIHHHDPKIHDYMTGVTGSFDTSMSGIENMLLYGYNVTIKIIISKINYLYLENIAECIKERFGNRVAVQFTSMDYSGRAFTNRDEYYVTFKEYQNYLEKAIDLLLGAFQGKFGISLIEMPLCHLDPYYWRLFPRKNIKTDLYVAPNADSDDNTIHNLDNQCHTNYNVCKDCDARFLCHGAWQSSVELGGEGILSPVKSE